MPDRIADGERQHIRHAHLQRQFVLHERIVAARFHEEPVEHLGGVRNLVLVVEAGGHDCGAIGLTRNEDCTAWRNDITVRDELVTDTDLARQLGLGRVDELVAETGGQRALVVEAAEAIIFMAAGFPGWLRPSD